MSLGRITELVRVRPFRMCSTDKKILVVLISSLLGIMLYIKLKPCFLGQYSREQLNLIEQYRKSDLSFNSFNSLVADKNNRVFQFNRSSPFVFIGGPDRHSGADRLGKLLSAHNDVNCGHDLRAISHLLVMKQKTLATQKERTRLELGGVGEDVFRPAVAAFIIEILTRVLEPAVHLCNEDSVVIKDAFYLHQLFPSSRFILVIRDGRAVAHSRMTSNRTSDFNVTLYEEYLAIWDSNMHAAMKGCRSVGMFCLPIYYESIVAHPIYSMKRILAFLNIPFPDHRDKSNALFFDTMELALIDGNNENTKKNLISWSNCAPRNVFEARNNTDLLRLFGYLRTGFPPDYRKLNPLKLLNIFNIQF